MRFELPIGLEVMNASATGRRQCRCTIKLDGKIYRCIRPGPHDGMHDAQVKHPGDGMLVRW